MKELLPLRSELGDLREAVRIKLHQLDAMPSRGEMDQLRQSVHELDDRMQEAFHGTQQALLDLDERLAAGFSDLSSRRGRRRSDED